MRIAIVSEGFKPYIGGVETRYTKLAEYLCRKNEVDVITLLQMAIDPENGKIPESESSGRLRIFRINAPNKYFLEDGTRSLWGVREFSKKCLEYLKRNDYDVVLSSQWPLLHIVYIKSEYSHNLVIDWHEVWGRYYWKFGLRGLGGYILEKIVAKMNKVKHIAVSNFTRERLKNILGVKDSVPVIWNGIDPVEYDDLANTKREFGKIVFFGRFAPHKGIDLLIRAFKIVKRSRPEASLHIIGDGPLRNQIIAVTSRVEGVHTHIAVPRKRLLENIKSAWTVVIPSHREGHGISYIEAMAAGTPVISIRSPYNAFSSMVKNREEALLADPEPNSLAEAILELLKNEDLHKKLSDKGRVFALRFNWENIGSELEKVLEDVMDK